MSMEYFVMARDKQNKNLELLIDHVSEDISGSLGDLALLVCKSI